MSEPLSLYLHLPFCHKICPYCSFYKHTPGKTDFTAFIDALLEEGRRKNEELGAPAIRTVYLGGGTPSLLSEKHLSHLFLGLQEVFDFSQVEEVDLEANPSTFHLSKAQLFRELGVSRVSLGVQSFQENELKALGRDHTAEAAAESFQLLREAKIPSCNLDLMFSVPHQTEESWQDNLTQALALKPDHISCYNLTYEEDTAYFEQFEKGKLSDDPDLNARLFTLAHETLTSAGFHHYETSNYSTPGHHSRHNLSYWEGRNYLGLGPSAVSTIKSHGDDCIATRWKNAPDTQRYIQQIQSVGHAMHESEHLSEEQFNLERIALLLRTDTGLPLRYLPEGVSWQMLLEHDLATVSESHLTLTRSGALLVDAIAEELAG
ncbi:radical SAM family heme chaperone HemW [Roseibacillus persicicus]|uniref:radical SAM family heme chaperone HemW n=1 Tax=Roseibacillus persicicus TaxID=454148 RepID=UPI00398B5EB0